ncbi:MAG TPA: hypothetical protein VF516_39220 [Kofleriaceae bacterium]
MASGEEFEVDLSAMALPLSDAAQDTIVFASSIAGCVVEPPSIDLAIAAHDNRVTKHFRMRIRSGSDEITEITARARNSGSADSFVIRVIV